MHVSHSQITLSARPLAAAAFQPFGKVVEQSGTERRHMIETSFSDPREGLHQAIWVSRLTEACTLPLVIDQLERHPYSHQAFIPLLGQPYLVVCCPDLPDGRPDLAGARAFVADPYQGIIYRRNVWHAGLQILASPAEFVVVMALSDDQDDILVDLEVSLHIEDGVPHEDARP